MPALPPLSRALTALTRRSDLALAALIVGVVAAMLVPLPTPALDLLLTVNLALALVILLTSLYTRAPLALSTLPSLLLLTTLLRLGLNVSSTRLILLQADAGRVIDAVGATVVGGDLIVGVVVFALITLIQLVVIARGSERVAEVAARFSLDALPGRQMAIDADLRAGALSLADAQHARAQLHHESRLYGAMDGALKFVKGDAIAGLVITAVNLVAGFALGVSQQGMTFTQAANTYALLTVGDGLISQLPALLLATAAGIVVTRSHADDQPLGPSLAAQLLQAPRALATAAALLLALALAPGLPAPPLLVLAALLAGLAWLGARAPHPPPTPSAPKPTPASAARVQLDLGPLLAQRLAPHLDALHAHLDRARLDLAQRRGFAPAAFDLRTLDALPPWRLIVRLDDQPAWATDWLPPERASLARDAPDTLRAQGLDPIALTPPPPGLRCACWLPVSRAEDAPDPLADDLAWLVAQLTDARLDLLLTLTDTQALLTDLSARFPQDVDAVIPSKLSLSRTCALLQRLLRDRLSVLPLRSILGAVASADEGADLDAVARRAIAHDTTLRFADPHGRLPVYTVEREIEAMLRDAASRAPHGAPLHLPRDIRSSIRRSATRLLQRAPAHPIVFTAPDVRAALHDLLARDTPDVVVLCPDHLDPGARIHPLGTLSARDAPPPTTTLAEDLARLP